MTCLCGDVYVDNVTFSIFFLKKLQILGRTCRQTSGSLWNNFGLLKYVFLPFSFPPPDHFLSRACLGEEDKGIVQIKHKTINSNFSRRAFFPKNDMTAHLQEWYDSPFTGQTNKEKNWKSHFKSSSHHGSISVTIWKAKTCILLHQKSYIRRYCSVVVKSTYWWLKEGKEKNFSLTLERGNILQMLLFQCRISSKTSHCQRHGYVTLGVPGHGGTFWTSQPLLHTVQPVLLLILRFYLQCIMT